MRRLGTILLVGVVAGAAARYYIETRARSETRRPRLIDWSQARSVALRVSQWEQAPVGDRAFRRDQYTRLVKQSEPLIAEYLGVQLPEPISRVYVHDRREWLEANFTSFEQLFLVAMRNGRSGMEEWARFAWDVLKANGRRIVREGKPLETDEENLTAMRQDAKHFADRRLEMLQALQVC